MSYIAGGIIFLKHKWFTYFSVYGLCSIVMGSSFVVLLEGLCIIVTVGVVCGCCMTAVTIHCGWFYEAITIANTRTKVLIYCLLNVALLNKILITLR